MIRAVIDTNVFISGIFWKGPPYLILEAWSEGKFKLIISSEILIEYERVLNELSKKANAQNSHRIFDLIKLNAEMVTPVVFAKFVCRDKDDDKFLAAALGGSVQFLVTGDEDLLVLGEYHGLKILKPKLFLDQDLRAIK
ncbi:MAG TPA: putative toxin-antitoxin system toxin component, PIN family [Bacteriovoracaceae bacterium]|nr:putative toxin-antitoxin system toxin component, PIN family [Bacteriovoracaceae bacterium]